MFRPSWSCALAVASGVLLALSFPRFGHPAFGWIALAPLLVALSGDLDRRLPGARVRSLGHAFGLGVIAGAVYFAGTLYWITRVMVVYGGLQTWVALLVNAALVAYLALFPALFAVVMRRLVLSYGPPVLMTAPLVWVATELGRTHLFGGFPWALLGYSQVTALPVAQLSSVFGVYGVSALVVSAGAAAATSVVSRRRATRWLAVGSVVALVAAVAVWGSLRIGRGELTHAGDPLRVGLLQGNVNQEEKWNAKRAAAIFSDYIRMTREAVGAGAELVIWPESATPFMFEEDRQGEAQVRALARELRVPILFGSDQIERGSPVRYYNAAFLVRADGSTGGVYRKMHLVPFGEYVPLKQLLFFAAPLVEAVSDFSAGDAAVILPMGGHLVQHGDLLRDRLSGPGATVRRRWQPAADDDHQRRVVRPHVGAVSALRAGVDAGDRGRAVSGAVGEHRHQRHRRSVRPGGRADPDLSAGDGRRRRAVPDGTDLLCAPRRRLRLRVGGRHRGDAARGATEEATRVEWFRTNRRSD